MYKKYNTVSGLVSYNVSQYLPIKVYISFVRKKDSRGSGTQNVLFISFCELIALYLKKSDSLRNNTNHGMIAFWVSIGMYVLISISIHASG